MTGIYGTLFYCCNKKTLTFSDGIIEVFQIQEQVWFLIYFSLKRKQYYDALMIKRFLLQIMSLPRAARCICDDEPNSWWQKYYMYVISHWLPRQSKVILITLHRQYEENCAGFFCLHWNASVWNER